MEAYEIYKQWLSCAADEKVLSMLNGMEGDAEKIEDAFFKELRFGTGGLRGKLGAGTNRMNVYTVGRATFGLADHILKGDNKSLAIAYDSRNMSAEFAMHVAKIMSFKGVEAYLFDTLMPTPVLSYAVRKLGLGAGAVVTASHNPKEYNGYKVYNERGCQITDAAAAEVTACIEKYGYFNEFCPDEKRIHMIGEEILDAFLKDISAYSLPVDKRYYPKVVYTPLNGTGRLPVKKLFEKMGVEYTVVPEQEYPDGNFTTCPYPNPEEKEALSLAVALAKKTGADLVIATDPDADRMGIAYIDKKGNAKLFSGNETGVLMENFILSKLTETGRMPLKPYIVKTIVTTPLAAAVAESFGAETKDVLTGFKYIGEAIDRSEGEDYVFGMEESYGYLVGVHARDKDAVSAVMTLVQAYCYYAEKGLTLPGALDKIYEKYGCYSAALHSEVFEGKSGMEYMSAFMENLRKNPYKEVCGNEVTAFTDYGEGINGLPGSNVLKFGGAGFSLIVRPSGTEPKIKFYLSAWAKDTKSANAAVEKMVDFVKESLKQ